jgi:Na+-transporting methylmalonyl-CoA/oxaloacetate decarboxylase gamma subunit
VPLTIVNWMGRVAELLATAALVMTGMLVVAVVLLLVVLQLRLLVHVIAAFTDVDAEVELLETVQVVAGNVAQVLSFCKEWAVRTESTEQRSGMPLSSRS